MRARRACPLTALIVLSLPLVACSASPGPQTAPTSAPAPSATAKPSPSPSPTAATPSPTPSATPSQSAISAPVHYFGFDPGTVGAVCRPALAAEYPGAAIDDLPLRGWSDAAGTAGFDWIVRSSGAVAEFPAVCVVEGSGTAVTLLYVTVQDI